MWRLCLGNGSRHCEPPHGLSSPLPVGAHCIRCVVVVFVIVIGLLG